MTNEREILGQGSDHKVYRSLYNQKVIKIPRCFNLVSMVLTGMNTAHLQKELDHAKQLTSGSDIKIPETRIIRWRFGYVMVQDFIEEDHSVSDLGNFIASQNIQFFTHKYHEHSKNFISNKASVYWIDPTKDALFRTPERLGLISYERCVSLRGNFRKIFGF